MRDGLGGIDSVAIVGGTSDIGLAIARELTRLGARRYVLAGRDPEAIRAAAAELPIDDVVAFDIADLSSRETAVEGIFRDGDLDVVVLAAGVLHTAPGPDQVGEMALVNGAGSIALLAELGDRLRSQGHGQLVVLSSIAVVRPRPSNYWYGAGKVGLDFAARGLSDDLQGTGVSVTVVRPGFVHTKMTEGMPGAPFSCGPEDVGRAVTAAVQADAGGVLWVPGILRWLAFLLRWLPRPLLHRLDR